MAGDYAANRGEPDQSHAFAERRGIRMPECAGERRAEPKARSMFAGFRPKVRDAGSREHLPESTNSQDRARAIQRYARAAVDIARMKEKGLPVLPHQQTALGRAGEALDRLRPHGARDLAAALERQPALAHEAARGDVHGAMRSMAEELRVRTDPQLRAARFMERWWALEMDGGDGSRAARAQAEMIAGLREDPVLRAELARSAPELGLDRDRATPEQMLQRQLEMQRQFEMNRARDHDRGRSR
jgi:hypothetical protein